VLGVVATWVAGAILAARHGDPGVALDAGWASAIEPLRSAPVLRASEVLAELGGSPGSIVVAVAVGLLILRRAGLRPALAFAAASLLSEALVRLIKTVEPRVGPSGGLFDGIGSFPSGHTANAAVLAVTLVVLHDRPWTRAVGAGYVVLMALSRTLLGAHWATDTAGGAVVGTSAAALVWALAAPRRVSGA
jgi:undecaprenyl-diphosphatase